MISSSTVILGLSRASDRTAIPCRPRNRGPTRSSMLPRSRKTLRSCRLSIFHAIRTLRGELGARPNTFESAERVASRGDENARTVGLAPHTPVRTVGLRAEIFAGIEPRVVDHQLPVEHMHFF